MGIKTFDLKRDIHFLTWITMLILVAQFYSMTYTLV